MRAIGWLASAVALAAAVVAPRTAAADTMDPALARLVTNKGCRVVGTGGGVYYNPASGFAACGRDDAAFAKLVAQYGAAIAPTAMHSARTTGYGGFELAIEGSFTTIDNKADYWINGTEGPQDPSTKNFSVRNKEPPGMMQLYTFKIRKGFPFGIELTGNFGYLAQTSIYTLGADVRWSLFEGFRTGIPAIFPELSVGGSVRTITGTDQLQLTVVGVDGQISKPIPIAGTAVLTPWIGYQFLRIFGDSGLIDLTPNTDAVGYCGYAGTNTPANRDPTKPYADGQPVCNKGTSADFNNTTVFNPARLNRHRIVAGLQVRVQMVMFGGQFMYDVVAPGDANKGEAAYKDVNRQMTLAFDLGAVF
ncbi:MAG: hypothetical protein QM820_32070 [Minicystis sp.]